MIDRYIRLDCRVTTENLSAKTEQCNQRVITSSLRPRLIVLASSVEPRSSSTISLQLNVSYYPLFLRLARNFARQRWQGRISNRWLAHAYCELNLTKQLGNLYLPPVKTIDTYFLRQIMRDERRVRQYTALLHLYAWWLQLLTLLIVLHARSDKEGICSTVPWARSGGLHEVLRAECAYCGLFALPEANCQSSAWFRAWRKGEFSQT